MDLDMAIDLFYAPMYYRLLMNLGTYSADDIERYADIIVAGFEASGRRDESFHQKVRAAQ
jgi:hypothetical protein